MISETKRLVPRPWDEGGAKDLYTRARDRRTTERLEFPLMHETRTGHGNLMTREDWVARKSGVGRCHPWDSCM